MNGPVTLKPTHTIPVIAVSLAALVLFCLLMSYQFVPRLAALNVQDRLSASSRFLVGSADFLATKWYLVAAALAVVLGGLHLLAFSRARGHVSQLSQWALAALVSAIAITAFVLTAGVLVSMVHLPG
jgi:type II secretory pathway component PulF